MLHPSHIAEIQRTWNLVAITADEAASRFYTRLFEHDPELAELFAGTDMTVQRRKFSGALAMIVRSLDRFVLIVPTLQALGRDHLGHGVLPSHYELVQHALIDALSDTLGDDLTPEARAAWNSAYAVVAEIMQTAVRHSHPSRPAVDAADSGGWMPDAAIGW